MNKNYFPRTRLVFIAKKVEEAFSSVFSGIGSSCSFGQGWKKITEFEGVRYSQILC